MVEDESVATGITERIKVAFESADLTAIGDLLDPDVRWGTSDDPVPSCQNRGQVLAWYQRGRKAGVRARVTEIVAHGNKILVGLKVVGNLAAGEQGGEVDRWQVLTVADGRIVDIRGFDERSAAASRAGALA
jgi:ketosteroid isomerase-like protein